MKKLIFLALAMLLAMSLTICAFAENGLVGNPPEGPPPSRITGTLSLLNMTEEEYAAFVDARIQTGDQMIRKGYTEVQEGGPGARRKADPRRECRRRVNRQRDRCRKATRARSSIMTRWTPC